MKGSQRRYLSFLTQAPEAPYLALTQEEHLFLADSSNRSQI